jgi:uncharacterized protein (TIGR02118 family)
VVKVMFSWKDNPDKSAEECEAHYRSHHMKLARQAFDGADGFRFLAFNRVRGHRVNDFNAPESRPQESDIDSYIELYFDSQEQMEGAMKHPVLSLMFADHANFMEVNAPANIKIYAVDETVILGQYPG